MKKMQSTFGINKSLETSGKVDVSSCTYTHTHTPPTMFRTCVIIMVMAHTTLGCLRNTITAKIYQMSPWLRRPKRIVYKFFLNMNPYYTPTTQRSFQHAHSYQIIYIKHFSKVKECYNLMYITELQMDEKISEESLRHFFAFI